MALIDQARQETKRPGVRCAFGQWFDTLPAYDEEDDDVTQRQECDLLAADDVPTSVVARIIAKASRLTFNDDKAGRHRHKASRPCSDCVQSGRLS